MLIRPAQQKKKFLIIKPDLKLIGILLILIFYPLSSVSQENKLFFDPSENRPANSAITYRNPLEYDLEYIFELHPDLNKIDRNRDLKLWIPVPREWDSQKNVRIVSIISGLVGYLQGFSRCL
jgi:hypothetical protein